MSEISAKADRMIYFLVGACVAFGRSGAEEMHVKIGEAVTELHTYIASLETQLTDASAQIQYLESHLAKLESLTWRVLKAGYKETSQWEHFSDEWQSLKGESCIRN